MLARTVTRALTFSSMPFLATAEITGVSMTRGLTLICTASSTLRPARSMAAARSKVRVDLGPVGGDECVHDPIHVAAGQVVGFQFVDGDVRCRPSSP